MSRFDVVITRRAERDIARLDNEVRTRIHRALLELTEDPLRHARRLSSTDLGQYRVRVGDWRVIFDLERSDVVVLRIGHRREIYRRG
ncbi:MAG: type II toxin-antitoxin system RelE/ParE family toxin [Deltaproteobacteria bacterium]|nr:type II toxin-antitoxin system RelE/ParE family toxin [Deltaproteobacteria bacterium]